MTSTHKTHSLYILLPVHNRYLITQNFIHYLQRQTFQDYHLVLLDDGSNDGTAAMVEQAIPNLTILRGTGDWWWGGALHQGYLWLQQQNFNHNPVILIMNDDTEFEADFLEKGINSICHHPHALLTAECYKDTGICNLSRGAKVNWWYATFIPVTNQKKPDCLGTTALFFRWKSFEIIGGFKPNLLPHYFADYEFTYRAKRKGFSLYSDPEVKINWNIESTGHHYLNNFIEPTFRQSLHKLFSRKSARNPIPLSVFIWLACPWYLKPISLGIVWIKALAKIFYLFWQTTLLRKN